MSGRVGRIYDDVSGSYDWITGISTLHIMALMRKAAVKEAILKKAKYSALDVGTGTGSLGLDIWREASKRGSIVKLTGIDPSRGMIVVARRKAKRHGADIRFEIGKAERLRYRSNSFDLVTSGFAVKHVEGQREFSREAYRVLKNGGKLVLIEASMPKNRLKRLFMDLYWGSFIRIGYIRNAGAYKELRESIDKFDWKGFAALLRHAGFKNIRERSLFSGAAKLIIARK